MGCIFNEPSAYLLVSPTQIIWSDQNQPGLASLKDGTATATKSAMTITGIDSANREFRGVVMKRSATIGTSDYTTPWTLESNVVNNSNIGCVRYSDGMELHKVINVTANNSVFIRSRPSAKGKALETVLPASTLLVDPTKRNGVWMRAEIALLSGGAGRLPIVRGWVNRKYINPQLLT